MPEKLGPGRQIVSQDNPSGVSRIGGQAGTQAPDPTPTPGQKRGSRAGSTTHTLPAEYARPHYLTPASALLPVGGDNAPSGSWVLSNVTIGPGGQRYGNFTFQDEPAACRSLRPGPKEPACLAAHGFHVLITYQPAGRFWAFQGIEAGIFLVLAAALIAVTFRLVLARDA